MVSQRGRRARNVAPRANGAIAAVRQQNRRDNGHAMKPSLLPPSFATRPWNAFTYSVTYDGTGGDISVTTSQIVAYLRNKLGLEGTAEVPIKLEMARVWSTAQGGSFTYPILTAQFYELQASGSSLLQNARMDIRDHGALNTPAKAGYLWPLQDRREVISDSQNLTVLQFTGATGTACTVMVNFLYRTFGQASGTSQVIHSDELEKTA